MTDRVTAPGRENQAAPPPLGPGIYTLPPASGRKDPRKNDIMSQRNRWPNRLWRFVRATSMHPPERRAP